MFKTDLQAATGSPVCKDVWYKKVQKKTAKERPEFCFLQFFCEVCEIVCREKVCFRSSTNAF